MESRELKTQVFTKEVPSEELPSLLEYVVSSSVVGFDSVEYHDDTVCQSQWAKESEAGVMDKSEDSLSKPPFHAESHLSYSISISLPASPSGIHMTQFQNVVFSDENESTVSYGVLQPSYSSSFMLQQEKHGKFYSQPIPAAASSGKETGEGRLSEPIDFSRKMPRNDNQRDKRFDVFKTWSGRLERQLSNLRGKPHEPDLEANDSYANEVETAPAVERYFDALEGPELDTLRALEVSVLPEDNKWPFLLRFPISTFGMCLGVSSQAILWKTLATAPSMEFLHVSLTVNLVLWCISIALMCTVSFIYILKVIFFFEAVRREYYHPIRVNFFFAPWIACLFLAIGVPPSIAVNLHAYIWYILMAPIFCLELKIYGQWMSGGQRRLSKVANPSNHLSIVGNFVGALLGAAMGLKEGPIFFFAVGLAHYIVLFVTLYQRLPTSTTLPKELHPVFFLFVAAPSVACMAWAKVRGDFDYGSRIAYFIALFLYVSLAVRVNFFRGFRFSLAWWAYTFPMTGFSIATIKYSLEVTNVLTQALSVGLSAISSITVTALLTYTIIHAFILRDLFPNDISIAIAVKRPKFSKILAHLRSANSDMKDIEALVSKGVPEI